MSRRHLDEHSRMVVNSNGRELEVGSVPGVKMNSFSHGKGTARGGTVTKSDRLLQAAQDGDIKKVQKLIKAGIDVNYESPLSGVDAVGIAAEFNEHKIIKLLLDSKARLDHPAQPSGVTPRKKRAPLERVLETHELFLKC